MFDETGLRTVFHHHCAGYVETPDEIATLLDGTNPERLGLVFDAGHYVHGTGSEDIDLVAALNRFKERIWYIHLKDIEPKRGAPQPRGRVGLLHGHAAWRVSASWAKDAWTSLPCCAGLRARDYKGYVLVEQDILPGMGTPKESAARNREYIRSIEVKFCEKQLSAFSSQRLAFFVRRLRRDVHPELIAKWQIG